VKIGSRTYPASYPMYVGAKAAGAWNWPRHLTSSWLSVWSHR